VIWDVPKNGCTAPLRGLTSEESNRGYELIGIADALAYWAQGHIRAVQKKSKNNGPVKSRKIVRSSRLVELLRHPKNMGVLCGDCLISSDKLNLGNFGKKSTLTLAKLARIAESLSKKQK